MKPKKIVIIGGAGFIGSFLTRKIFKRKNIDLTIIYRTTKPVKTLSNIKYEQNDGSEDGKKLGEIIKDSDFLLILTQPNKKLIKNIIRFGTNIKKIIYTSTMLLYKDTDTLHDENYPIKPLTDYEKNKYKEEILLTDFANKNKVKLCIARLSNVYGDIQNRGIIQKMINSLTSNSEFILNGEGIQKRDYIYVHDVAQLLEFLTFYRQKNTVDIFNLCTGKCFSINDVIGLIEKISDKKLQIKNHPPVVEKKYMIGDNTKITKLVKPFNPVSLKSGLNKAYRKSQKQNV